jgi:hypothetical protein
MKSIFTCLLALISVHTFAYNNIWQLQTGNVPARGTHELHPSKALVYHLNNSDLSAILSVVSTEPEKGSVIELPAPDGSFKSFRVWQTSNMETALAAKYPEIRSFTAYAIDNKRITAKLDLSPLGFDAMIYDGANTYFIDPYSNANDGYYLCYYKKDYSLPTGKGMHCSVGEAEDELKLNRIDLGQNGLPKNQFKVNGTTKRVYRLALGCTGEYAVAVAGANPTKSAVLIAMNKTLNRVNGVYETELSIHMNLVAKEDTMIALNGTTDFYDNLNDFNLLWQNQKLADSLIGSANYDIGHVFSSNSGGRSDVGCVCANGAKARGATGQPTPIGDAFDIDYVVHELGHQYGAYHTFNANSGFCGNNNAYQPDAYEPGSGSTIMAYAGICGSDDNLQPHSDDYFHAKSLDEINDYTTLNTGATCPVLSSSGNIPNVVPPFSTTYFIPYLTPFELIAPVATDANGDPINYCWEEWDLGDFETSFVPTKYGPIFRSFRGTGSQTRVFPRLDMLRNNILFYLGEKLPDVARPMNFTLTTRDIHNGWGCYNTPSDLITLQVINTGNPFVVMQPNTSADYWQVGSTATVTWNVAGTTALPISCNSVDIYLSLDDGQTYPYTLATAMPNTGSATVTVPIDAYTASARVKVKGSGNVFFDISNTGFIINNWPVGVPNTAYDDRVLFYPIPAKDILHMRVYHGEEFIVTVTNALGQQIWQAESSPNLDINVSGWAKGVYNVKLTNKQDGKCLVKRVVVE